MLRYISNNGLKAMGVSGLGIGGRGGQEGLTFGGDSEGRGAMPAGAEGQMPQDGGMGARGGNAPGASAPKETDSTMIEPTGMALGAPKAEGGMNPGATNPGGNRHQQDYGLIGPVKLIPYRIVPV